jgi:hypothetical protein
VRRKGKRIWKRYICYPPEIKIEVDDSVYNRITFKIYLNEVMAYTKIMKLLNSELEQKSLDSMVNMLCEIIVRLRPSLASSNSLQLEKVVKSLRTVSNGAGLRIWNRN